MPWKVLRDGEQWCVHKLDGAGEPDAAAIEGGCHPTEAEAENHMRALYANVEEAEKRQMQANVGGGVDRDKLEDGDFVFSDSRTFPVVRPGDVSDAVSSWGRYRGPHSFEEFKRRLIALCRRKGASFVAALPAEWDVKSLVAVKASGDWVLDVLGVPFGGPIRGKDAQGEYFSTQTRTHEDKWASPPVVYYHGFGTDGKPAGSPEYIGRTLKRWTDGAGHWFRVELDRASEFAKRVWEAAQRGLARASSGSVAHLVRKASDGHILEWPIAELSVFDTGEGREPANGYAVALPVMKAIYDRAGLSMPDLAPGAGTEADDSASTAGSNRTATTSKSVEVEMAEQDVQKIVAEAVAQALKAQKDAADAEAKRINEERARVEAAVAEAKAKWEAEAVVAGRLPYQGAPYAAKFYDSKYDHLDAYDMALAHAILSEANRKGLLRESWDPHNEVFLKSLAGKMVEAKQKGAEYADRAIKCLGPAFKANEIERSTLASYGDEWVGVGYSTMLWEKIRAGSEIVGLIPTEELKQGEESLVIPLESTDPTFYKVAQASDLPSTEATGWPNATITSSRVGTAQQSLTVAKMGARVLWTGEMDEDSLIRFVPQVRAQLERAGAEQLEHAVLDGDTTTTASSNINDIAGTPAATDLHLLMNGVRHLALITNSANARSGGALTASDFLETLKLMGVAGKNAMIQPGRSDFILDPWTHWKALELDEVKTRDVFSAPTVENGILTSIWGHKVRVSHFMHYAGVLLGTVTTAAYQLKANSAGKIDQDTEANNSTGSILAVRWDQWRLGYKRRMTMETTRIARADTTEIVAMARVGLTYRDTEAAAISYNVTV